MHDKKEKIGVIGLGKLGLPMLCAFVKRGFDAYGYDTNTDLIDRLVRRENPYKEPGIEAVIRGDASWDARFSSDLGEFISKLDIIFIIVPTPSRDNRFNSQFVRDVLSDVSLRSDRRRGGVTCVVTSTLNPGDCDLLNKELELGNNGVNLVYSPEFIALGSVLSDMLHPDVVLLGGQNEKDLDRIFSIYSRLYLSFPEYHRLSFFEAETAKLAINTFVTTKISFANALGMFVAKKSGSFSGVSRVLNAVGGDSRIGRKYFKFGGAYGGPCFPRDNKVLSNHMRASEVPDFIPTATDKTNDQVVRFWADWIDERGYELVVLSGIAYKSGTDFLENSFFLSLGAALEGKKTVYYVDPLIAEVSGRRVFSWDAFESEAANYKSVLILVNYGEIPEFAMSMSNVDVEFIWGSQL